MNLTEPLESRIAPATLFGVTNQNHLIRFESSSPGVIDADLPITGIGAGETIQGMDLRPATGELFLLTISDEGATNSGRIYTLDPATGTATQVGTDPFSTALVDNVRYGFDFDPKSDQIRVVNGGDNNLRVDPDSGVAAPDVPLDDPNNVNNTITGAAYGNNFAGATESTLYGIEFASDKLVRIEGPSGNPSPNGGVITPIGSLGAVFNSQNGFDIAGDGTAYAAMRVGAVNSLYTIDLNAGAATATGKIGDGTVTLVGLTAYQPPITIAADGRSATYTDVDGDLVTVRTNKGEFGESDFFLFSAGGFGRAQLGKLNLSDDGEEFAGANITITAKKSATGDGLVDVGWIDSTKHDLGTVVVSGDLARITAGDTEVSTLSVVKLKAGSHGVAGNVSMGAAAGFNSGSLITGKAGSIALTGDARGFLTATVAIGSVKIGGDLHGAISSQGPIQSLTIGGSIDGREGSGVLSALKVGTIKVGQSVIGGELPQSGYIYSVESIASISIARDLIGSAGAGSGTIIAGQKIGAVKIGGDLRGGTGSNGGFLGSLHVSGGVVGSEIASITVGGSITSVASGSGFSGLIGATTKLGSVTVKGNIQGDAFTPVHIVAGGSGAGLAAGAKQDVAIGKITVGGDVERANILAGYKPDISSDIIDSSYGAIPTNNNASIGAVKVGRDWTASNLVAGAGNMGSTGFGDDNDVLIATPAADSLVARIASVAIKGRVYGTAASGDHFGFIAQQIGKFSAFGIASALTTQTDAPIALTGLSADVRIHEI